MSFAVDSLVHAESQFGGNERLHAIEEEVVEPGTGLAADLDDIFETRGGDQGDARAFALKDGVRADGGAVQEDDGGLASDLTNRFGDRLRGIGGRGEDLQEADTPALDPDAVGEGAAGIDGDAEDRRLSAGSDRAVG